MFIEKLRTARYPVETGLLIALAIFGMVKIINRLGRRYEDQAPGATAARQGELLEEIRDLLKRR
jgi:large-conductance mechanosensitive channel